VCQECLSRPPEVGRKFGPDDSYLLDVNPEWEFCRECHEKLSARLYRHLFAKDYRASAVNGDPNNTTSHTELWKSTLKGRGTV
jgi:hypothetical protein